MYKCSDFTKPVYKTGEIMEILNISYSTIKPELFTRVDSIRNLPLGV